MQHILARLILLIALPACLVSSAAKPTRPNVLMICVDDLNDWLGCLGGNPEVKTPNIDALAARGRNFSNAHCAVPVCSPSRVSIMSGLHATTTGSYELGASYQSIGRLDNVPTMQQYFQQHGYRTLAGGKVLHHGFGGRLAADIDETLNRKKGGPRPKQQMNWKGAWDWGAFPDTDAEMYDYQLAQKSAGILREKTDEPFFLTVGFFRPHVPLFVPQKWYDMYDPETITLPKAPKKDLADVPPNFQNMSQIAPTPEEVKAAGKWRSLVHAYYASVSFVDMCVGEVMKGLDAGPHRDNTIVVLWSDHGFHFGEKQHLAKRTLWEESTRVPFIVAGPGIKPGNCREAVSLLDVYPTLVELCNLPENSRLEGLSVVPQLRDPARTRERPALISSYFGNHAIRSRDWRYIRYQDGAEELYDHRSDAKEYTNLAASASHREVLAKLAKWLPKNPAPEVKPVSEFGRKRK
ncbi:MAG: choline-sulfatase [Limisphaerales bacterium]|jgi:choline-sulfatase